MLALELPKNIETRLFVAAQAIGISQDLLAEKAIRQYLENLELVYQLNMTDANFDTETIKKVKSRAGALAKYANPSLIETEKSAWANAMLDKHGQLNNDNL